MAKTDLSIPSLGAKFIDVRDSIPGDNFNWSWVRPLSQVKYLAIHHSASPDNQTPTVIANYHINSNGWGGIGYHFVLAKDGTVYYVGDISTARANVANLNEQVLGICLVGNFTSGREPTDEQIDSAHKLCDFFINSYPDLSNLDSWDSISGHKELPGQATTCPGDNWPGWKPKIISGLNGVVTSTVTFNSLTGIPANTTPDRGAQITDLYRTVLGRDPDMGGLQTYTNSAMTIEEILRAMINSQEHQNLIRLAKEAPSLQGQVSGLQETVNHQKSQIDSMQMSLASVNGQIISLKESLHQREAEISNLRSQIVNVPVSPAVVVPPLVRGQTPPVTVELPTVAPVTVAKTAVEDPTLTILQAAFNLYKFLFSKGGVS